MFSLDKILLEFVGANWMSLYVGITLLKGAAMLTKGTTDDKIATLLANLFKTLRSGKVPPLDAVKKGYVDATVPEDTEEKAPKLKETPQTSDNIH